MNNRRCVVLCILTSPGRIFENRGPQLVVWMQVSESHTLVNQFFERLRRLPSNLHSNVDEHGDNTGILTNGSLAHSAHAAVNEDLSKGIFGRLTLLHFVGAMNCLHEIGWVVIGDELECICHTIDNIAICNYGHVLSLPSHLLCWRWCRHWR